jgi:hypothetical protein
MSHVGFLLLLLVLQENQHAFSRQRQALTTDCGIVKRRSAALCTACRRELWRIGLCRFPCCLLPLEDTSNKIISLLHSSASRCKAGLALLGLAESNFSQRIFTILLRRGRLPIQSLAQHTRLNRRQLQHGLVVLIQQNLIYYFDEGPQATYYEANQGAAYGLIRSGKILEVVESRYGDVARDVVQNLFLLGHAKVGELIGLYQRDRNPPANGTSNTLVEFEAQPYAPAQLDSILCDLLQAGLVEPVTDLSFQSPDDTYNGVEQNLLRTEFTGGTKGTKQKEQLNSMIRDKLESMRSESQSWKPKGNKRKLDSALLNGTNGNAKRRRYSSGSHPINGDHTHEDEGLSLDVGSSSYCSRIYSRANLH